MKTDEFFYQIFRRRPLLLFELLGLESLDEYQFESVEVKHTHKRIDGFLIPKRGKGPVVFLELQGYLDKSIYWRAQRSVATWFEQSSSEVAEFLVVIIFLDKSHDPGFPHPMFKEGYPLVRATLGELVGRMKESGQLSPLVVLEPLVLPNRKDLAEKTQGWVESLSALKLNEEDRIFWLEQLEYAIIQRFQALTIEEIKRMLHLTPLEETVAGKQVRAMGWREGMEKGLESGIEQGELIGGIRTLQRLTGEKVASSTELQALRLEDLKVKLASLTDKAGR